MRYDRYRKQLYKGTGLYNKWTWLIRWVPELDVAAMSKDADVRVAV